MVTIALSLCIQPMKNDLVTAARALGTTFPIFYLIQFGPPVSSLTLLLIQTK